MWKTMSSDKELSIDKHGGLEMVVLNHRDEHLKRDAVIRSPDITNVGISPEVGSIERGSSWRSFSSKPIFPWERTPARALLQVRCLASSRRCRQRWPPGWSGLQPVIVLKFRIQVCTFNRNLSLPGVPRDLLQREGMGATWCLSWVLHFRKAQKVCLWRNLSRRKR